MSIRPYIFFEHTKPFINEIFTDIMVHERKTCFLIRDTDQKLVLVNKCVHEQYDTIVGFMDHVTKIIDQGNQERIDVFINEKIVMASLCQKCCLYIVSNYIQNLQKYVNKSIYSATHKQYCAELFIQCMHHFETSNFILNHSKLFGGMFATVFYEFLRFDISQMYKDTKWFNSQYRQLMAIISSIQLMKPIHWQLILLIDKQNDILLKFITNQLKSGFYLDCHSGKECMVSLLILMMQAAKYVTKTNSRLDFYVEQWKQISIKLSDDEFHMFLHVDCCLLSDIPRICEYDLCLTNHVNINHQRRWQKMKCQYCGILRSPTDLRKCKSCRVARYCSQKCQRKIGIGVNIRNNAEYLKNTAKKDTNGGNGKHNI
eukprot:27570_1